MIVMAMIRVIELYAYLPEYCKKHYVLAIWWCALVVVFPNTDEAGALCGLERVRAALECRIAIAGLPVFTASFGLATVFGPIEFNELVHTADMALLEAKRTGRNKV
nr:diguanylate cyclase [Iodobacter fluviatilis]